MRPTGKLDIAHAAVIFQVLFCAAAISHCRNAESLAESARGRSLWARLQAGTPPAWLEPVGKVGAEARTLPQPFAVFRVKL